MEKTVGISTCMQVRGPDETMDFDEGRHVDASSILPQSMPMIWFGVQQSFQIT